MVLYFSGTGNSRHAAKRIADALDDQLLSMNDRIKTGDTSPFKTDKRLVIVTPTYAWRIPRLVENWLRRTEFSEAKRAWFVMTCGSEIGSAAKYNHALCWEKQLAYMGTTQIVMPENYIAMFNGPRWRRRGRLLPRRSRTLIAQSLPSQLANHSRCPATTFTTAS